MRLRKKKCLEVMLQSCYPFSMKLKEWIDKADLSQKEFARMVGVTQPAISHLIAGRKDPSLALMKRIEAATKGKVRLGDWKESN